MAIQLDEKAAQKILEEMQKARHDPETTYLRFGVAGGGCSGLQYEFELGDEKTSEDREFESHGIKIIVDPESYPYVIGSTIHFEEHGLAGGFTIENPNTQSSCGCGHSFTPTPKK